MPYWQLYYHFVWATKYRQPLITPRAEPILYRAMRDKTAELGAKLFALNGIADHVHLVVSVPPALALSTFIGQVKGASASTLNQHDWLPCLFKWQTEYAVFSFGERDLGRVVRYVRNQKQHHRQQSTDPDLEWPF